MANDLRVGYNISDQPREQTAREMAIVQDVLREFAELQLYRYTFATQWEEASLLIWPDQRNTFQYGNYNWPGQKKTDKQVDATGMAALERFTAIVNSLLTPENMQWHTLEADDEYVMKDRATRLWFDLATKILFKERYRPTSGFIGNSQMGYKSIGAFGNSGMMVEEYDDTTFGTGMGLRYRNIPLGGCYIRVNHQNIVDGFIIHYRRTPQQILQEFGSEKFPVQLKGPLEQHSQAPLSILQRVVPANDFDPGALNRKRMRFKSEHVFIGGGIGGVSSDGGGILLRESGYYTFPLPFGRYTQAPDEIYGRGPAQMVLPALKTINAEKSTFLKAGHRAGDPILLLADDGLVDFKNIPGAQNKGGMTHDGKPLVGTLQPGNIQITKEMMDEEALIIKDMFLVSLFQILTETPQMSATEVIERTNEKGILLAPTVGRQTDQLGTMIHRELDLLIRMGKLPPMPPRLREARGKYNVVYTSPLAKAMRAQEAAGFMRTVEMVKEVVAVSGDPSPLDRFDFDSAVPDIANINGVPEAWLADDKALAQKRKARAIVADRQAKIQAMPAQAAMIKAQAVAAKSGGGQSAQPGQASAPVPGQFSGNRGIATAPAFNPAPAPGGP